MRNLKTAALAVQIKDEIRKLNQIGKSEIHTSFDEEAAVDLILRVSAPGVEAEVQGTSIEVGISPVIKYRLLVGGVGIAYEGESELEGRRQFNLFTAESKTPGSSSSGESVTLFRNFGVVTKYLPPE
jgi:hypothetical protein